MRKEGHEIHLVFFKKDSVAPVREDQRGDVMYTHYVGGGVQGCNFDVNPYSEIEEGILRETIKGLSPDIIGLSTRTFWLDFGTQLMQKVREDNPNSVTIAGGYGPSLQPKEFLQQVEYIVFGEGEKTLKEIARLVDRNEKSFIKNVPNVGSLNSDGNLHINPAFPPIKDLNALPVPDWDDENAYYIEYDKLITDPKEIRKTDWYDLFGCRGCPSGCTYCMAGQWGRMYKEYGGVNFPKVRIRSPDNVLNELVCQKKINPDLKYIRFMDSIFSSSVKWLDDFIPGYIEKINLPFFCNIEVRFQSMDILERLCAGGLAHTSLGIQSGSRYIREEIYCRKIENEAIVRAAKFLKKKGVVYQQDLLGFNPFDTIDSLRETFDLIVELPPNPIVVFELKMFPGSALFNKFMVAKPKGLERDIHEMWIYLWHLASFGGVFREYAQGVVDKYAGDLPVEMKASLNEKWKRLN
jgi:radical SAM superfamily enzyme YgiQ (UPF0313 family)